MTTVEAARDRVRALLGIPWKGDFAHPTLVMGIVNVTPDSFQAEGRQMDPDLAVEHALRLVEEGADILDIGGESTRPGSVTVSASEEIDRVIPVIRRIAETSPVPISIDTRKAEVAEAALEAGARIVNDVSAARYDDRMLEVVTSRSAFLCLMHAPLDVHSMKWSTAERNEADDVVWEVRTFLEERAQTVIRAGVDPEKVWIDPGFGFGKSIRDNLRLLRDLDSLTSLPWAVLVGASRKSTMGAVLGGAPPEERVEATVAAAVLAARSGAAIVRVHDVRATVRGLRAADAIIHA